MAHLPQKSKFEGTDNISLEQGQKHSTFLTMSSLALSGEFPNLNGSVYTPFECNAEPNASFEKLWKDARGLEDEIEILKWMARRKELEWDCAKEMVDKKKSTIKAVKKKINMVKTINDLGMN